MDITKVLAQLRAELANLDAAILSLERLQSGSVRRGRPPGWAAGRTAPPSSPARASGVRRKTPAQSASGAQSPV